MPGPRPLALCAAACALTLAACERVKPTPEPTATATATTGAVIRDVTTPAATPTPPPAPVQAAIQTQPGPKGAQVALNKVAVTGDILTVQLTYQGGTDWQNPNLKDVSIIDDATAQRIGVLKDGEGNFLASPINGGVKTVLGFKLGEGPQIVWFKFPAPPATSKTISINIPDVVPFDGVSVTR